MPSILDAEQTWQLRSGWCILGQMAAVSRTSFHQFYCPSCPSIAPPPSFLYPPYLSLFTILFFSILPSIPPASSLSLSSFLFSLYSPLFLPILFPLPLLPPFLLPHLSLNLRARAIFSQTSILSSLMTRHHARKTLFTNRWGCADTASSARSRLSSTYWAKNTSSNTDDNMCIL